MKKGIFNLEKGLKVSTALLISLMAFAAFSFAKYQKKVTAPDFKVYTENGEVNLKEGISENTTRLHVRAEEADNLKFLVAVSEVTLVADGLGRGTLKSKATIKIDELLSDVRKYKDVDLLLEVKEYYTQDSRKVVEKVRPEKPLIFQIPVVRK